MPYSPICHILGKYIHNLPHYLIRKISLLLSRYEYELKAYLAQVVKVCRNVAWSEEVILCFPYARTNRNERLGGMRDAHGFGYPL